MKVIKNILLVISLMIFSLAQCSKNTPFNYPREYVEQVLKEWGFKDLVEKTTIVDQLAVAPCKPTQVVQIVDYALSQYAQQATPVMAQIRCLQKKPIMQAIFKNHPRIIEDLIRLGYLQQ